MRVLLAEDEAMVGESIAAGLRHAGHSVDWVRDGRAAETALATGVHEMLLLDLGLPRRSRLAVLKALCARSGDLPLLVITARDAMADRIACLDAGADDYLVKPFDLDELAARMWALGRRRAGRAAPAIEHGALKLDPATRQVFPGGTEVALSGRSSRCSKRPSRGRARWSHGPGSRSDCTAGSGRPSRTRSKCTSTRSGASSAPISSARCAAPAT
jgi:two-component system response regulator QseB